MDITRGELRRKIFATELDDNYVGTVSSVAGNTFTVSALAYYPAGHFNGAWVSKYGIPAGTGTPSAPDECQVISHNANGVFTVTGFSTGLSNGDSVELHKKFSARAMTDAMDLAFMDMEERVHVPVVDTSLVGVASQYTYVIPTAIEYVYEVALNDVALKSGEWSIVRGSGKIRIPSVASGDVIELRGLRKPTEYVNDDMSVEIPQKYVVYKSLAHLYNGKAGGQAVDADSYLQRAVMNDQRATQLMGIKPQDFPPNCRRVN